MKTTIVFIIFVSSFVYSQNYSPELQRKLDAFEKADKEIFSPWFSVIVSIPDINTLSVVDKEVSHIWWERHVAKGWEVQEDEVLTDRNDLLERISFRLQWLCHNEAMKELGLK